jgi:hypothetical protein
LRGLPHPAILRPVRTPAGSGPKRLNQCAV